VEAVTGAGAVSYVKQTEELVKEVAALLKGGRDTLVQKVKQGLEKQKELEKEIERLKQKLATSSGNDLESQIQTINGVKLLVAEMEGLDGKSLRAALDQWKDKLKSGVVVLASVEGEKVNIITGVTADLTSKVKAGELVNFIAAQVGGKGGGRPDMAQAGGTEPAKLPAALASVSGWVAERVG
ncbi:MAG TPA: DHHA1 domain-containing protein, partial [Pseudomonadales bacterium]|nr:DHHA1 domain-containing protein [Pseudomonadales bacterium]